MATGIYLLGKPRADRHGVDLPRLRGKKAWALLTYLILSRQSRGREHLASLLFDAAADPLGALRWNLAEIRRMLGPGRIADDGDVHLILDDGSRVDVLAVISGSWTEAIGVPGLGRDLLEGMDFSATPAFDAWLLHQRRRLLTASAAALRTATMVRLATGDAEAACEEAMRLVAMDPLDEESQALLIRSYVAAGDHLAARRQYEACATLLRKELGVMPGHALTAALPSGPRRASSGAT